MAALKLVEFSEEEMELSARISSFYRKSFYSTEQKEGVFVDVSKMYTGNTKGGPSLPTHAAISVEKLFNGEIERESLRVSVCQNGIEDALRRLMNLDKSDEQENKESSEENEEGGSPKSVFASAKEQLQSVLYFFSLEIIFHTDGF
jgi:hypothetical protein